MAPYACAQATNRQAIFGNARNLAPSFGTPDVIHSFLEYHCYALGYDVASSKGLKDTVAQAQAILGLEHVPVIHTNDSKGALNSHLDRHANIGEGYIGLEGFRRILTDRQLKSKAFVLETPIDNEGDDLKNVETLKSLCRKRPTSTNPSS